MNRLPHLFRLQAALEVLSQQTDVLPAVGGATEEELHPDVDEIEDARITKDDTLLDEPLEFGQSNTYVPLQPLKRPEEHVFQYFQDGSMRSFFAGTALEHDRQTPVIIGQVGGAALKREDDGRLRIATHPQRNLLLVAFSQISQPVRDKLQEIIRSLGQYYELSDIEAHGQATQDLRRRTDDSMRRAMVLTESAALVAVLEPKLSATLLGRTNAAEMAERSYRFLNPDIKAAATRLEKGQLTLSHAVFRELVKIKFQMVAYRQPS